MKYFQWFPFLACVLLLSTPLQAASPDSAYTAYSALPKFQNVQLSPNGQKIAYVQNTQVDGESTAVLQVYDFETKKSYYLLTSDNKKIKINWYRWASEEYLAVSARYEVRQRTQRYYSTRMYIMDYQSTGKEPQAVINVRRLRQTNRLDHNPQFLDTVVDWLPDDPEHILMAIDMDEPHLPSVYKVKLGSNRLRLVEKGKRLIRTWMTDQQGNLRLGVSNNYTTGERNVLIKKDDDWENLFTYNAMNEKGYYPQGFDKDPDILYYSAYQGDYLALFKMQLSTGESELVFKDDHYDVNGSLIYSNKTGEAIGINHPQAPGGKHYWDPRWATLQQMLDEALPEFDNYLVSFNQDETRYVLYSEADNKAPYYSLGDTQTNKLNVLFGQYPHLLDVDIPEHKKVKITARDGLQIEAYLTLPVTGNAPYPTIVHPHGGPGARDYAGFDYFTAYFTSQGYAVLRPNFRGSSGYGFSFAQAQMQSWGLEMQDDITDATHWLVKEGIAKADKMCIVGASYGGYAAMMATVKTPDLFQCAVSFAGVSNLKDLVRSHRWTLGKEYIKNQLGDDSDDLEARSPYYFVKNIRTPLLLVHGDEDRSVPVAQSRDMAEELEDHENKHFRYVELDAGDHYLSIQTNRHRLFAEMDAFLKTYL